MMGYANFSLSYMDVNQFEISEEGKGLLNGSKFCRSVQNLLQIVGIIATEHR